MAFIGRVIGLFSIIVLNLGIHQTTQQPQFRANKNERKHATITLYEQKINKCL
jgi:hypothetical protein